MFTKSFRIINGCCICMILVTCSGTACSGSATADTRNNLSGTEILFINLSAVSSRFVKQSLIVETCLRSKSVKDIHLCIPSSIQPSIIIRTSSAHYISQQVTGRCAIYRHSIFTVMIRSHSRRILIHISKTSITRFSRLECGIRLCTHFQKLGNLCFNINTTRIIL